MPDLDVTAVAVATVAAFVLSGVWYGALGDELATVSPAAGERGPGWAVPAELARTLVLTVVVAGLASEIGIDGWAAGVALGLALWIGFPAVLWAGAMLHERTPWRLAAIHGGDWLLKLPVVGAIVSAWP